MLFCFVWSRPSAAGAFFFLSKSACWAVHSFFSRYLFLIWAALLPQAFFLFLDKRVFYAALLFCFSISAFLCRPTVFVFFCSISAFLDHKITLLTQIALFLSRPTAATAFFWAVHSFFSRYVFLIWAALLPQALAWTRSLCRFPPFLEVDFLNQLGVAWAFFTRALASKWTSARTSVHMPRALRWVHPAPWLRNSLIRNLGSRLAWFLKILGDLFFFFCLLKPP